MMSRHAKLHSERVPSLSAGGRSPLGEQGIPSSCACGGPGGRRSGRSDGRRAGAIAAATVQRARRGGGNSTGWAGPAGKKQAFFSTEQPRSAYGAKCGQLRQQGPSRPDAWAPPGGHRRKMGGGAAGPAGALGHGRECGRIARDRKMQRRGRGTRAGWAFNSEAKHNGTAKCTTGSSARAGSQARPRSGRWRGRPAAGGRFRQPDRTPSFRLTPAFGLRWKSGHVPGSPGQPPSRGIRVPPLRTADRKTATRRLSPDAR